MPYIRPEDREQFNSEIDDLVIIFKSNCSPQNLYYIISRLIMRTIRPSRYRQMCEVSGVLDNLKREFIRRQTSRDIDYLEKIPLFPNSFTEENNPELDSAILILVKELREGCGDIYGNLNYCITSFIVKSFEGILNNRYLDIITVLKILGSNFYEQIVAPYEDEKIKQNGDVYD